MRLLYICYLTLDDPLVHTQVVAYLAGLASAGHVVHLLTFEPGRLTPGRRRHWRARMQALGIRWHGLRYHKRPSLPATVYDGLRGAICVAAWSRAYRLDVIHARTHVPAAMALIGRLLVRDRPLLVFDIRGLMVEEYEEAGRWRPGGVPSRVARTVENAAIKGAARIVILTNNARERLFNPDRRSIVHVIPCCADLEQISKSAHHREEVRARLGLQDATVMVYVGKFPSWSMPAAMADFFNAASDSIGRLHFLILTQSGGDEIRTELQRVGADPRSYTITSAPPAEIGAYLAASDFAISFIRPTPSTVGQSPTKLGEYLGAGLPVVYSAGIGDLDELMSSEVGIPVEEHSPDAHREAARGVLGLVVDPRTREACHETAEQSLSLARVGVPRYLALYGALASQRALTSPENRRRRAAILDSTN
jgi:glycosyltransferase involved in cell wall biosynthesis